MSAARRGAVAATVLLAGVVALLLSPATGRAVSERPGARPVAATVAASSSTRSTTCVTPIFGTPTCSPISGTSTSTESESTTTTATSTLTYAVLPGDTGALPPTATPKPPPTPTPSPAAVTDTGASALGTDTSTSTEPTQASTVINPQPGGDASSVLPLTVLAFLILAGGGAIFLITRLR